MQPCVRERLHPHNVERDKNDEVALLEALVDPSAWVRLTARHLLRERGDDRDFRAFYLSQTGNHKLGVIGGLGDVGRPEDVAAALAVFHDSEASPALRGAALRAAVALGGNAARDASITAIADESPTLSRHASDVLMQLLAPGDELWLGALLTPSHSVHVRRNALRLVGGLSRWHALPLVLQAGCEPDLRARAEAMLRRMMLSPRRSIARAIRRTYSWSDCNRPCVTLDGGFASRCANGCRLASFRQIPARAEL